MAAPQKLRPPDGEPVEPVEEVVQELEALLERARRGEVRALAVAASLTGNEILSLSTKSDNVFALAGALAYEQSRLFHWHAEGDP